MGYTHIVTAYYQKADGQMEKAGFLARKLRKVCDGVWFESTNAWGIDVKSFIPNHRIVDIKPIE